MELNGGIAMSKEPIFTGTCTALTTPFAADGAIDYPQFARQIERQLAAGIDALCVCGTTGEASTLSAEERVALTDFCVHTVKGRVPVLAGTGSNDTRTALLLSAEAEKSGADALLLVTPYYNKSSQAGLIRHFQTVADAVTRPILLYNIPTRTGVGFTADTYAALAEHPNIRGVKEASGNFSLVLETLSRCGGKLDLYSGNDDQTVPLMALGAKGVISVASNVLPREMGALTRAFLAGDTKRAAELQIQYEPLLHALFWEVNPIPVKAAMQQLGLDSGYLRLPLIEMGAEGQVALRKLLQERQIPFGLQ
jgi:4-hydroxy-tetrahydrodipicolinate synthase